MQKNREGYGKNWKHFVYKLDNLFRSIWGSDEKTHLLHRHFIFLNLLQLWTFLCSVCTIQGHVINFQPFLASFAIVHAFTDLLWELNDHEIEKHYKMNFEKVETWHGITISHT